MISVKQKAKIIKETAIHDKDTGSPEVQVAILSKRIDELADAFEEAQERQPFAPWFARHGRRPPGAFEVLEKEVSKALFRYHKEARAQEINNSL